MPLYFVLQEPNAVEQWFPGNPDTRFKTQDGYVYGPYQTWDKLHGGLARRCPEGEKTPVLILGSEGVVMEFEHRESDYVARWPAWKRGDYFDCPSIGGGQIKSTTPLLSSLEVGEPLKQAVATLVGEFLNTGISGLVLGGGEVNSQMVVMVDTQVNERLEALLTERDSASVKVVLLIANTPKVK